PRSAVGRNSASVLRRTVGGLAGEAAGRLTPNPPYLLDALPGPHHDGGADRGGNQRHVGAAAEFRERRDLEADECARDADQRAGDEYAVAAGDLPGEPRGAHEALDQEADHDPDEEDEHEAGGGVVEAHGVFPGWCPDSEVRKDSRHTRMRTS